MHFSLNINNDVSLIKLTGSLLYKTAYTTNAWINVYCCLFMAENKANFLYNVIYQLPGLRNCPRPQLGLLRANNFSARTKNGKWHINFFLLYKTRLQNGELSLAKLHYNEKEKKSNQNTFAFLKQSNFQGPVV